MRKLNIKLSDGRNVLVDEGTELNNIVAEFNLQKDIPVVLGNLNGQYYELTAKLNEEGSFDVVDAASDIGQKTYARTLQFILIKSVLDLFPDAKITIEHSLSKGIFGEIRKSSPLNEEDVKKIKDNMMQIISKNIPIRKLCFRKDEAVSIFQTYGMEDKVKLLEHVSTEYVKLYELDGIYDYFYGSMAYSTGAIKTFDIMYYDPGFILRFPQKENFNKLPEFVEQKKLTRIFRETEEWGNILDVGYVGSLNEKVENGNITDIIMVSEALHEKKIAYIADMISARKDVKFVFIAGPSSSGKTTFARRLGIQLRVNGLVPIPISLDDYFVDREKTPKDENGNFDFESIYALDLNLFNENLESLLNGEKTELPTYNFKAGRREWTKNYLTLPENGVIIIEGIHGLNEMLTPSILPENKFKIYISALTQLNLDDHNRIATTDVRIIRRIVRDYLSRGYSAEDTLKMWPSIKRGEEKNIFVHQENADVMFNSALLYELCILKKYALTELQNIGPESSVYYEALRLKSFLHFFHDVDEKFVPYNSILREFIGGSCFYKY
jgi:uridine kinase